MGRRNRGIDELEEYLAERERRTTKKPKPPARVLRQLSAAEIERIVDGLAEINRGLDEDRKELELLRARIKK